MAEIYSKLCEAVWLAASQPRPKPTEIADAAIMVLTETLDESAYIKATTEYCRQELKIPDRQAYHIWIKAAIQTYLSTISVKTKGS